MIVGVCRCGLRLRTQAAFFLGLTEYVRAVCDWPAANTSLAFRRFDSDEQQRPAVQSSPDIARHGYDWKVTSNTHGGTTA